MPRVGDDQGKAQDRSAQNRYPAGFAEALGRTIKVLRADQGLSRKELAEAARISYSGLTAIENGVNPPSSSLLVPIAAALGVRPSQLLELAEQRLDSRPDGQTDLDGWDAECMESPLLAPSAAPASPEADWAERFASPERRERHAFLPEGRREVPVRNYLAMNLESAGPERGSAVEEAATRELAYLLQRMAPDDIERLLDYARRLAR